MRKRFAPAITSRRSKVLERPNRSNLDPNTRAFMNIDVDEQRQQIKAGPNLLGSVPILLDGPSATAAYNSVEPRLGRRILKGPGD